ncbi:MAG: DUF3105 domain-containing protein [Acidimicrobiales bacterium]
MRPHDRPRDGNRVYALSKGLQGRSTLVALALLTTACSDDGRQADVFGTREGQPQPTVVADETIDRFNSRGLAFGSTDIEHVEGPVDYGTTKFVPPGVAPPAGYPPVAGRHNPKWLRCDVYDAPVPNEYAVHSLERGAVWFAYRPGLPAEQVRQLAALAKTTVRDENSVSRDDYAGEFLLISPYEGLPAPIVAVAWATWLAVEDASDPALSRWVTNFAGGNQGGKGRQGCRKDGLTPEKARQELGSFKGP